ncbi:outer membrane protein assembly factor BamB family protein [Microbulbifer sediminum]|uniref:outer membrane protein assembly factor BamB family protein n=1 Tax=Microbulbifer sediminum TaxID=2904250 RepID=UPI001F41BB15|nr:PQQ-binding-like beta-propeller repeat protein [Microbulbifer sediminum]
MFSPTSGARCVVLIGFLLAAINASGQTLRANFDLYRLTQDTQLEVGATGGWLANDEGTVGQALLVGRLARAPEHGALTWLEDGSFSYVPDPGFTGNDRLHYVLVSESGEESPGLVVFHVKPAGDEQIPGDWAGYGNGPGRQSYQPGFVWHQDPETVWAHPLEGWESDHYLPPAVVDGQLFLPLPGYDLPGSTTRSYSVVSRSAITGTHLWDSGLYSDLRVSPPSVAGGQVFFQRNVVSAGTGSSRGEVLAVDVASGELTWQATYQAYNQDDFGDLPPPVVAEDTVWVQARPGQSFYGYDAVSGNQRFSFPTDATAFKLAPTVHRGKVYVGRDDRLDEYGSTTTALMRTLELNRPSILNDSLANDIYTSDGRLYVLGAASLMAIDQDSLDVHWSIELVRPDSLAVADGLLYVTHDRMLSVISEVDGTVLAELAPEWGVFDHTQPILTDDSLFLPTYAGVLALDRFSLEERFRLANAGPAIALADGVLFAVGDTLSAYRVAYGRNGPGAAPKVINGIPDQRIEQDGLVRIDLGRVFSHPDESLGYVIERENRSNVLAASVVGNELQLQAAGFPGEERLTVRAHVGGRSAELTFAVSVFNPAIVIEVFDITGAPVNPGQVVSGEVTGRITVYGKTGQHVQFYKNFRTLEADGHNHFVDQEMWQTTFTLDTADFFDGENLLSVHVHPMNVPGNYLTTDFDVGVFRLVTSNSNPAPNSDTQLPRLIISEDKISLIPLSNLVPGHLLFSSFGAVRVLDDYGEIGIDGWDFEGKAQVIAHLGASVLGKKRSIYSRPPKATGGTGIIFHEVNLLNFQKPEPRPAKVVLFFNDNAGRANYGFYEFELPALPTASRDVFDLNFPDVELLDVHQGGHLLVGDDGYLRMTARVKLPETYATVFDHMTAWVGNQPVLDLNFSKAVIQTQVPEGRREFVVELPIPASEIEKLEQVRLPGADTAAFAVWADFWGYQGNHLPVSEHIHVSSLRTFNTALADDDLDRDGVVNDADNCPLRANVMQRDVDGNGKGDACFGFPLKVLDDPQLGRRLVGGRSSSRPQHALYLVDLEYQGYSCSGINVAHCAAFWPPLTVNSREEIEAAKEFADISLEELPDGRHQVLLTGRPLHFYAGDLAPGQLVGNGIDGKWRPATITQAELDTEGVEQGTGSAGDDRESSDEADLGGPGASDGGESSADSSIVTVSPADAKSDSGGGGGSIGVPILLLLLLSLFRRGWFTSA